MGEVTTVKVSKRTKGRLAELGKKDETYEEIIERLIEFHASNSKTASAKRSK